MPNRTGTNLLISLDTIPQFDVNGYWSRRNVYQYNITTQGTKIVAVSNGNMYQAEHKAWTTSEVQARAYICSAFDYDTYGFPWFEMLETSWNEANLNAECINAGYPMVGIFIAGYSKVFNMPFNFHAPNLPATTLTGFQLKISSGQFNAPNLNFKYSNIILEALNSNSANYGGHTSYFKMENSNLSNNSYNTYTVNQVINSSVMTSFNGWGIYGLNLSSNNTGWTHGTELRVRGVIFDTGKAGFTFTTPFGLIITDQLYLNNPSDTFALLRDCKLVNGFMADRWLYRPAGGANYKMINLDINTVDNNTYFAASGTPSSGAEASKVYLYRQKTIKITDINGNVVSNPVLTISVGNQTKRYFNGTYEQIENTVPNIYTYVGDVNGNITTGTGDNVATMILESHLQWANPLHIASKYHYIKFGCELTITATGYETYKAKCDIPKNIDEIITLKPIKPIRKDIEGNVYKALLPEKGSDSKLFKL